jgi:AmmeMemoRadiSam system protein A
MEEALGARRTLVSLVEEPRWLEAPGATFVTLRRRDGELHGCIGSLEPRRPLGEDVRANAAAAAVDDPRAPSVGPEASDDLVVEVSVLGPLVPLDASSRADVLAALRPGMGVMLEDGRHRATFLPQVWESVPEPARFLAQLERKAGLPVGAWSPTLRVFTYEVEKYSEASTEGAS